jgi:glucose-6-phosphate 1-epimerase
MAERTALAPSALPPTRTVRSGPAPAAPCVENRLFQGQPCLHLRLACGDAVTVALHGAQVMSWVSAGRERLYLSPRAVFDGRSAIRGGVPVCFPQFNQRGPLPKHGFARNLRWSQAQGCSSAPEGANQTAVAGSGDSAHLSLRLNDNEFTRALWPQSFEATLTVQLEPGSLKITLQACNVDDKPLLFTGALHTYLAVDDIAATRLGGLQGQPGWDALTDQIGQVNGELRFNGEFDRVYAARSTPLTLHDGTHRLQITQSASFADTVVWNPGAALCGRLTDMPANGFARMLCVEAAQVMTPAEVRPGDAWAGWQRFTVL